MNQTDRLLKVGQKLEKGGLASFKTTTPSGLPAYYRSQGLQIIPSEAEEIDTHNRCHVVITPEAAALSGLVMTVLRILGQGDGGHRRSAAAIVQFKSALSAGKPQGWEQGAAKDIVTAALKFADKPFPSANKQSDWGDFDGIGEHIMHRYIHRRRLRDEQSNGGAFAEHTPFGHELVDPFTGLPEHKAPKNTAKPDSNWSEIRGIMGIEMNQHWIPVSFPSPLMTPKEEQAVLRTIVRRGLKPEIAMTIIANRAKDLKRRA